MAVPIASVTTASRFEQRVTEAPSSVTLITAEEIRRYGWRRLSDVLGATRGFHLNHDRLYHYLGVRGFARPADYNSRVLVLVNGHRINENIYDGVYLEDGFPVDMDLVERIEIIRGPGSSLYGTNAVFAVVNVRTRKAASFGAGEVSIEGLSLGTQRGRATVSRVSQRYGELLLSATGYTSRGQRSLSFPELAQPLLDADGEKAGNAFVSWRRGGIAIEAGASIRRKWFPPLNTGQVIDQEPNRGQDTRGYVDVSYVRQLGESTEIQGRAFLDRYLFDGRYRFATDGGEEGASAIDREFANGSWLGGEMQMRHQWRRHQVTAGFEARLQPLVHLYSYRSDPYEAFGGARVRLDNHGVFLQDEWRLAARFRINAGVRWDRYSTFGSTFNPRLALVWQPNTRSSLKLMFGEAFRAPNPYELNYQTAKFRANPSLRPERVRTLELAWEQHWRNGWHATVSLFQTKASAIITQIEAADATLSYNNVGRLEGSGWEAEIGRESSKHGWDFTASYGFQPFLDSSQRLRLTESPRHMGKTRASIPIFGGRIIPAGELHYYSPRLSSNREPLPGYWWPSLTVTTRRWQERMDLALSVYNASNRIILHPVSEEWLTQAMRQDGRVWRLQLRYTLR